MNDLNLIRKLTWAFHKTTKLDWDELFSEVVWRYYRALDSYDPSRGKASSYIWMLVSDELKTYLKDDRERKEHLKSIEDFPCNNYKLNDYQPFWESLSKEAMEIAEVILSAPKLYITADPEKAKERIIRTMLRKGWSRKRVYIGIRDLQLACL